MDYLDTLCSIRRLSIVTSSKSIAGQNRKQKQSSSNNEETKKHHI